MYAQGNDQLKKSGELRRMEIQKSLKEFNDEAMKVIERPSHQRIPLMNQSFTESSVANPYIDKNSVIIKAHQNQVNLVSQLPVKELKFTEKGSQSFYDNKNFFPFGHKSSKSQTQVAGFGTS